MSLASDAAGTALAPTDMPGVPALFGGHAVPVMGQRSINPYLIFAQPAAKEQFLDLIKEFRDTQDGDPFLILPTRKVRLLPLRLSIIAGQHYYTTVDKEYKDETAYFDDASGRKERFWAAVVVYTQDGAVPATCQFRTVKCGAPRAIVAEIAKASSPDWANAGAAQQQAIAALNIPWARVVGTVTTRGKTYRTGNSAVEARADVAPTGPNEWAALKVMMESEDGKKQMQLVADNYKSKLEALQIK